MSTIKYTETITYCEIEPLYIILEAHDGRQFLGKRLRVTHRRYPNGCTTLLVKVSRLHGFFAAWSSEPEWGRSLDMGVLPRYLSEMPERIRDLVRTEVPYAAEFFTDMKGTDDE